MSEASTERSLSIQVIVRGDDAAALARLAEERDQKVGEVVAELIQAAAVRT